MNSFIILLLLTILGKSSAGLASTWYSCNCHWDGWSSWSECSSSCGGGIQQRDRMVWHLNIPQCDRFEKCASNDMATDFRRCKTFCYNSGYFIRTSRGGYCNCRTGTKGKCCQQITRCGRPSSISHGIQHGFDFTYGHEVRYECDRGYKMRDALSATRRCTEYGTWSGHLPECVYAESCNSNPCKNQAECTNLLDDYDCNCRKGWSGRNCEVDMQPPVIDQCPDDIMILTSNRTYNYTWKEPIFSDPLGNPVRVTQNYENSSFVFPWGVHVIQYNAVKAANGLMAECNFNITIKPYPCDNIRPPRNGFIVCNRWMADYANVCQIRCNNGYNLPRAFKETDWYNCCSSGKWFPSAFPTECLETERMGSLHLDTKTQDSTLEDNKQKIQLQFIEDLLASNLKSLCIDNSLACHPKNVNIMC